MSPPHLNQEGGRFRASPLEDVQGRERELRSLADGVRRLVAATVTFGASAEETAELAAHAHALADRMEVLVPDEPSPRYGYSEGANEPHDFFQYDPVLGLYNPLALPVEMEMRESDGHAIGRACFDTPYEGPPGCVHGAVLAGVFDQVFNVSNLMAGVAGPTATLTMKFRKPTPLRTDLVFESWVDEVSGNRVTTRGRALNGDVVTVEAEGRFVTLDRERIEKLAKESG